MTLIRGTPPCTQHMEVPPSPRDRIIFTSVIASTGRRQPVSAELAKRVICACVREICFFRDFMGLKSHKFSCSLLARHLFTRQLACRPQTGSVACLSVAVTNGTKKLPVLSIEGPHKKKTCRLLLLLLLCLYARTNTVKIHGNLNKGASGSMKLN